MSNIDTTVHPFERAGLGKSPYRCVGCRENWFVMPGFGQKPGGTCDYCGTGILYEYMIKSSDGKEFVVGCDCVRKTNASVAGFREARLKVAREKRATKVAERRAIKKAEWDKIRAEEKKAHQDSFYSLKPELVEALKSYQGSNNFVLAMRDNLIAYGSLTERMVEVVERMLAEEKRQQELVLTSKHIGAVGSRIKTKVRVLKSIRIGDSCFNGYSVPRVLVKMENESGDQITWFTSSYIESSEEFKDVAMTIKEHGEFRDVKQTIVQRVSFK